MKAILPCGLLLLLLAGQSLALAPAPDGFPSQPVTILVPRAHGGASYQISAAMAAALERFTEVPVRVVTKPENHGLEALDYDLSLPPNGYTILENQDLLMSQFVTSVIALNPTRGLEPLAVGLAYSQLFVRRNESRFSDLNGLIQCARHRLSTCRKGGPLKVSLFGGPGATEDQLLSAMERALDFVTEKGFIPDPAERYLSLLKGDADLLLEQPGDVRPLLQRGLIKPIFTFRAQPLAAFPDTPSYADIDRPLPDLPRFRGFFVHPDTPPGRLDYLRRAFGAAARTPEFQSFVKGRYISQDDILVDSRRVATFMEQILATYQRLFAKTSSTNRR
jgi:tripartite-type tricarboxylate transporter receptor subunit TctC